MKTLLLAATFAITTVPVAAQAATRRVALLPVSGTNVHQGYLDAARDVLKDHLIATRQFEVITVAGESGPTEASGELAVARGREVNAELAVVVHLTRLSGTGRLRLMAFRVADGAMVTADSIGVAGGPDDLDPALKRMAVGLATGKPASATVDIHTVTQREADPLLKETATKIFGVRLGSLVALNRPADLGAEAVPGVGVFWMYDARNFLGEVAVDLHSGEGASDFAFGIGGYYPLSRGNTTPYVGASLSYAFSEMGGSGAHGLRLAPTLGVLWGRVSTVQLRAEIGYFANSFSEGGSDDTFGRQVSSTEQRFGHGPRFSVGLGF